MEKQTKNLGRWVSIGCLMVSVPCFSVAENLNSPDVIDVEIQGVGGSTEVKKNLIDIALHPFSGDDGVVRSIVAGHLVRSGKFTVQSIAKPLLSSDSAEPRKGYSFSATISADRKSAQVSIFSPTGSLQKTGHVKSTLAKNLPHKLADWIYENLLGIKGSFNTRLSFVSRNEDGSQLVVADSDGTNPVVAMRSQFPIMSSSWSPDGKEVAYVSFEDEKPVVYVQNLKTGERTQLSNYRGNNSAPAWSPNGKSLLLALSKEDGTQIYSMDRSGQNLRRLTWVGNVNTEPTFSPDGQFIFFTSDRGGSPQLYRMPVSGESEHQEAMRVTFRYPYVTSPKMSSDGQFLTFIAQVRHGFKVHVMNLRSQESYPVSNTFADESPCFSANGQYVIYSTQQGDKRAVYAVHREGGEPQELNLVGFNVKEVASGPFLSE